MVANAEPIYRNIYPAILCGLIMETSLKRERGDKQHSKLRKFRSSSFQGLAIICLYNLFLAGFRLTDFSKKRARFLHVGELLRANSQKMKSYFWQRATIKGQHSQLITSRELSNLSYHLTTNSPFSHLCSCSVKDIIQTSPIDKK